MGTDTRSTSIAKSTNSNASEINCFFESVTANIPSLEPLSDPAYSSYTVPETFLLDTAQVEKALLQLNRRKSPGPDGVPSWILCDHADSLAAPATHIFNSTMIDGHLPSVWKRAEVVPIPKVHPPRSITSDLRPISLTPILSKCFESFITKWLMASIAQQLDRNQYGNVKGRSTSHALLRMLHEWTSSTDRAKAMFRVLLVDFSKAFDLINHNLLIAKLEALDVPKALIRWIHAFLSSRQQRVRLQDDVSDWLHINGGVPQGTKLGPVLFLVMINDLHVQLPTVKYVDDTTIFECIPRNASSTLQAQADVLSQWCDTNGCKINTKKTTELRIDFSKSPREFPFISMNNCDISVVSQAKLLGVIICDDLSWEANTVAICSKASQRLHYLVNLKRAGLDRNSLVKIYCSFIRPILEYCSCVWHFALTKRDTTSIERIQKRALRFIFDFDTTYEDCLYLSNLDSLERRRMSDCKRHFMSMCVPSHPLHDLLPPVRESSHSLRHSRSREVPMCHTSRSLNSFVPSCLKYFQ